ncbi:hypothetical protein [Chryseobacterium oncorhynchi]|uniref:Uncharacterized protein n=1 Tax=Chryseobacterium oncorhynchi TaxID=741074 RepID=A0A316WCJ8_9FLAO|nr:hypothetical protein [Chryseobacterium oncorhynchi]PWN59152.1 hypothetical protein C1638_021895 [Chryseobacterium oncorhynchi]
MYEQIKEEDPDVAICKAEKISKEQCRLLYIIKSYNDDDAELYYIDENGLVGSWEEIIAIFDNGIRTF